MKVASLGTGTTVPSGRTVRPSNPCRRTEPLCTICTLPLSLPASVRILSRTRTTSCEETSWREGSIMRSSPLRNKTTAGAFGWPGAVVSARSSPVIGGNASAEAAAAKARAAAKAKAAARGAAARRQRWSIVVALQRKS